MKYAAEFPGLFGHAGSFSGAVDIGLPLYRAVVRQCTWGDPAAHELTWQDNDPTALAGNLRGVGLFVRTGDGRPGAFDAPGRPLDVVEATVGQMAQAFAGALRSARVRRAITVTGSGRLAVRTAPLFAPRGAYRVGRERRCADRHGRLRVTIDLGPAHDRPQTTFGFGPPAGWRTVRLPIERVHAARCR